MTSSRKKPTLSLMEIEINNESNALPLDEERVRAILQRILSDAGYQRGRMEIDVIDDETIHRLNVQFLGHDYATDVLSFEMDRDEETRFLEGNVIVSDETARDRSIEFGWPGENELFLYIVHGTLHLVGYDDHSPEDEKRMRGAERKYLALAGIDHVAAPSELGKKED